MIQYNLVYILYDGISNSVFKSQVFYHLLKLKEITPYKNVTIISFEPKKLNPHIIKKNIPDFAQIKYLELKRNPFFYLFFSKKQSRQLRKILEKIGDYDLIARGPFASSISKDAATKKCRLIKLQARAIATEEYDYSKESAPSIYRKAITTIKKQY